MLSPSKLNKRSRPADDPSYFSNTITEPITDVNEWKAETTLSLGFQRSLRGNSGTLFIPESLWVRQEMIDVVKELRDNNNANFTRQVLIGSPGVGKSVIFFLYALMYAKDTGKKVMYWRKATEEDAIHLFCIQAFEGNQVQIKRNKVLIQRDKNIKDIYVSFMKLAYPKLFEETEDLNEVLLDSHVGNLRRDEITMFVDGPKASDTSDTISGTVNFLCTSGGHPRPPNAENTVKSVLVLCGWLKDPFLRCIKNYATVQSVKAIWDEKFGSDDFGDGNNEDMDDDGDDVDDAKKDWVAELIYYYTGGRIGDGLKLLQGTLSFKKFEENSLNMIDGLDQGALDLAALGPFGYKSKDSIDSLRTYFKAKKDHPTDPDRYIQLVDSVYYLKLLGDRDMSEKYLNAYKEAVRLKDMTVAGQQFERMMHKVYEKLSAQGRVPFKGYHQAKGQTREGVEQISKGKYWVSSVPNFPSIDAAVWNENDEIYCVQYSVGKRHGFNTRRFRSTFLKYIPGRGTNKEKENTCFITYVTPSDQRNQEPANIDAFHWREVVIDVDRIESVMESAPAAFEVNGVGTSFTEPTGK